MIDTVDILAQLAVAVHRDAARRRRRGIGAVATAMVALALGGVAIAGSVDDWWTNAAPSVQSWQVTNLMNESTYGGIEPDLSKKATVARTTDAALVAVETKTGGYCMTLFIGAKMMGSSCTSEADSEYRSRADDEHWVAYGRILDARAAALDLSRAGMPSHVPLERGGFFLFDIPRDRWASLDDRVGDISILDVKGVTLRRACIAVGIAPPSPWAGGGGLGDAPGQCAAMKPIVDDPDVAKARRLVTLNLHQSFSGFSAGEAVAVWTIPNTGGGTCTFIAAADATPSAHMGNGGCTREAPRLQPKAIANVVSLTRGGSGDAAIVSGSTGDDIVRIEVSDTAGSVSAALANGAFLAEVHGVGPFEIVAYDKAGNRVASTHLPRSG